MSHQVTNESQSFISKARRNFDPKEYPDVRPWVVIAIDQEDKKPSTRLWKGEPAAEFQSYQRQKIIKFLRKHQHENPYFKALADRLVVCEQYRRCYSGACPKCLRLLQRWLVRRSKSVVQSLADKTNHNLIAITIIPSSPITRLGKLHTLSINNLRRRVKYALDAAGIGVALGGFDISFNEDRNDKYAPFWCVHAYLITSTANRKRLGRQLKKSFHPDDRIPRPIKISDFTNSRRRRSYAFKTAFVRRISCDSEKIQNGKVRKSRNTSRDKLRVQERLELHLNLDKWGLAERLIFRRAKPVIKLTSVRIRKT